MDDLGDVFLMIEENELKAGFANSLAPDVREKFLEVLADLGKSTT